MTEFPYLIHPKHEEARVRAVALACGASETEATALAREAAERMARRIRSAISQVAEKYECVLAEFRPSVAVLERGRACAVVECGGRTVAEWLAEIEEECIGLASQNRKQ